MNLPEPVSLQRPYLQTYKVSDPIFWPNSDPGLCTSSERDFKNSVEFWIILVSFFLTPYFLCQTFHKCPRSGKPVRIRYNLDRTKLRGFRPYRGRLTPKKEGFLRLSLKFPFHRGTELRIRFFGQKRIRNLLHTKLFIAKGTYYSLT